MIASWALTGCTKEPDATDPTQDASFAEVVAAAIDEAKAGGADQEQLDILREAQIEGVLAMNAAREAALTVVDCITVAGGDASYVEEAEDSGVVIPGYTVRADSEEALSALDGIVEECDHKHAYYINKFYQLQPKTQEARDAYLETQLPLMRACLEEHGYTTDEKASAHEVLRQAIEVRGETNDAVSCDRPGVN